MIYKFHKFYINIDIYIQTGGKKLGKQKLILKNEDGDMTESIVIDLSLNEDEFRKLKNFLKKSYEFGIGELGDIIK